MIINGYILQLCNYRQFLYYLIQNNIKLKDFDKAQQLSNNILNQKISDSFDSLVNQINPLLPNINKIFSASYYWCIDQCEFAIDINFKSRQNLENIYKTLVETTYFTFSSEDIYSFFGRNISKIHNFTKG